MMAGTRQSYYVTRYKVLYSQEDGRFFKTYTAPSKKAENNEKKVNNLTSSAYHATKV